MRLLTLRTSCRNCCGSKQVSILSSRSMIADVPMCLIIKSTKSSRFRRKSTIYTTYNKPDILRLVLRLYRVGERTSSNHSSSPNLWLWVTTTTATTINISQVIMMPPVIGASQPRCYRFYCLPWSKTGDDGLHLSHVIYEPPLACFGQNSEWQILMLGQNLIFKVWLARRSSTTSPSLKLNVSDTAGSNFMKL